MSLILDPDSHVDIAVNNTVTIVIAGQPTAKARPRVTRRGFAYTPAATRKYEAHGRLAAQQAMNGRPPIAGPVRAEITVDLPVPTSWSQKRREDALRGEVRPTTRPDIDNFVKAGMDAINEIVVTDDSLIVELAAIKRYALTPQLKIVIKPLGVAGANVCAKQNEITPAMGEATQ